VKILLSLQSRKLRNGKTNPKDYPYSEELIRLLHGRNIETVQVRTGDEAILPAKEVKTNLSLTELAKVIKECDCCITVDNFVQHYATYLGEKCVVIFFRSDPLIFGYPQNINLFKDRKHLRKDQFGIWEADEFCSEAFVTPDEVVKTIFCSGSATVKKLL
jgi:ADP-heptose:LPS heptosyltransferase